MLTHAAAHPGHDAGVAVHPADVGQRPRDARSRRDGHRRRNPRGRRRQARRASGALARAARRAGGPPVPRIGLSATQNADRDWSPSSSAARTAGAASSCRSTRRRAVRSRRSKCRRASSAPIATHELWDEIYDRLAALVRAAPLDAGVRQHAARGRARRASPGRAARRGRRRRPSRQPVAQDAARRRAAAQGRRAARGRRDRVARARHRHRHDRPGLPDRIAAIDRDGGAAHRPRRPLARRDPEGAASSRRRATSWSSARRWCGRSGAASSTAHHPGRAARHPGAADRRGVRRRRLARGRALRARAARLSLSRSAARRLRRRRRDAVRGHRGQARALRRATCIAIASTAAARAPRRAARGDHRRRRDSRHRALHRRRRSPRARSSARSTKTSPSRAWRGDVLLLGNTSWRIRRVGIGPRARRGCAGRGADDSLLARRSAGADDRALAARRARCARRVSALAPEATGDTTGALQAPRPPRSTGCRANAASTRPAPNRSSTTSSPAARCSARCRRRRRVIAERFFDEGGGMQLVIHAPFGARHQQGVGPGAAQAVLRVVQLRAAGGGDRRRHQHRAGRAAQLSARRRLPLPAARRPCRTCWSRRC